MKECSRKMHQGKGFKGLVFISRFERVRLWSGFFLGNFEMFFLKLGPRLVAIV
jgi:hypothetical protein